MKSPRSVRFTSRTIVHVDEARAADAQHRLRLERLLGLGQRAARVEVVPAHADDDVIAVRLDHLDLGHIDDVQLAVEFRQQARPLLGQRASSALELREQPGEQCLTLFHAARQMAAAASARASCGSAPGRTASTDNPPRTPRTPRARRCRRRSRTRARADARARGRARDRCRSTDPFECRETADAGRLARIPASAVSPSAYSPTTSRSASASQNSRSTRRPAGSSSTMMTFTTRPPATRDGPRCGGRALLASRAS